MLDYKSSAEYEAVYFKLVAQLGVVKLREGQGLILKESKQIKFSCSFFKCNGRNLAYTLFQPSKKVNGKGFIFCYPLGEERIRVHRVYYNFSKLLVQAGFSIFIFDYRGCGDSEGSWSEVSVDGYLEDIRGAVDYFANEVVLDEIGLLGVRFGATLVNIASEQDNRIKYQILWEPVVDFKQYFYDKLRINLATQVSAYRKVLFDRNKLIDQLNNGEDVNVEGYEVPSQFYSNAVKVNLLEGRRKFKGKVLICNIVQSQKKLKSAKWAENFVNTMRKSGIDITFTLARAEAFWELLRTYYPKASDLFVKTNEWINENVL